MTRRELDRGELADALLELGKQRFRPPGAHRRLGPVILRTLVADGRLEPGAISASSVRRFYQEKGLDRVAVRNQARGKAGSAGKPRDPAPSGTPTCVTAPRPRRCPLLGQWRHLLEFERAAALTRNAREQQLLLLARAAACAA